MQKDNRRLVSFQKKQKHLSKHKPRIAKDRISLRSPSINTGKNSKNENTRIAKQTMEILEKGYYSIQNNKIDIQNELQESQKKTVTYTKDMLDELSYPDSYEYETEFLFEFDTTLNVCQKQDKYRFLQKSDQKEKITVLNSASAKNPGGGFLKGSMAQEESIAIASGLYLCIKDSFMYQINRKNPVNGLYNHCIIYSPNIPIFRDEDSELLQEFYEISFIGAPAVNTGEARKNNVPESDIYSTMHKRAEYMFKVAFANKTDVLILGSWGCGVFGGDINTLANIFSDLLSTKFKNAFKKIIFATTNKDHVKVFKKIFG